MPALEATAYRRPGIAAVTSAAFAPRPELLAAIRAAATLDGAGVLRFPPPYRQMSVAVDEADLLYALIRALKPLNVLEFGTGLGLTARFIAEALLANGSEGFLITVEPNPEYADQAATLLTGLPAKVAGEYTFGPDWPHLVYIDSGVAHRAAHIREWLSGHYRGLVLVHDADRDYPELGAGVGVYLPTANGIWAGQSRKTT